MRKAPAVNKDEIKKIQEQQKEEALRKEALELAKEEVGPITLVAMKEIEREVIMLRAKMEEQRNDKLTDDTVHSFRMKAKRLLEITGEMNFYSTLLQQHFDEFLAELKQNEREKEGE